MHSINAIMLLAWQLFSIAGLFFLNFAVMFVFRKRFEKKEWSFSTSYTLVVNLIWLILIFGDLLIFVFAMTEPYYSMGNLDFRSFSWAGSTIKLAIIFYFLYMVPQIAPVIVSILASAAQLHYYYGELSQQPLLLFVSFGGFVLLLLTAILIHQVRTTWINKFSRYLLTVLLFIVSWSLLLLPVQEYNVVDVFEKMLKFLFVILIVHFVNIQVRKYVQHYVTIENQIDTDYLTKIYNRNAFEKDIEPFFDQSGPEQSLAFAMIDIDHFKIFNDNYGHLLGDQVLQEVSKMSKELLITQGRNGRIYRLGGEEFGILYRNLTLAQATESLQTICESISQHKVATVAGLQRVTVSAGISQKREQDKNPKDLYERVDGYLYHAKKNGRRAITMENNLLSYRID